jgi:hypothetical protein
MSTTTFSCGDRLRLANFGAGSSGCLARFPEFPERLLMLTAGHVVLTPAAAQGDQILRADTGEPLGRLMTWTQIDGDPTADAALIWVDPAQVSPALRMLGMPKSVPAAPAVGSRVRIVPSQGQLTVREATIRFVDQPVDMRVQGPAWDEAVQITYRSQIWLDRLIDGPGDSGSIAIDDLGRVVGMVVGGSDATGTVITPMSAILANAAWGGRQLEVLDHVPPDVIPPPASSLPLAEAPADAGQLKLDWLPQQAQRDVAQRVANGLAEAGLGAMLQAAALANAFAESGLDPMAHNTHGEDSVGLFQMNRNGGMGQGFSVEELQTVEVQVSILKGEITKTLKRFVAATSLDEAVFLFVRDFERPKDPNSETAKRIGLAHRFL